MAILGDPTVTLEVVNAICNTIQIVALAYIGAAVSGRHRGSDR
jgi:hypothetical protein